MTDPVNGIGYLKLTNFQKTTIRDIDRALWKLHREGMRHLIMDLRGNPGGLLTAGVDLADRFINNGRIVMTRGRNSNENFDYRAHAAGTWKDLPLVVLVDENSASASEIFAAAIKDNSRGTIVGHRTYGKGTVQGIFRMKTAHAGLCLTTAKFYSPNGTAISGTGVAPKYDVAEESTIVMKPVIDRSGVVQEAPGQGLAVSKGNVSMKAAASRDPALEKGVEVLRSAARVSLRP